jgi:hypothetical protein
MTVELEVAHKIGPAHPTSYPIRFPEHSDHLAQNEECCEIYHNGCWRRLRLHDYAAIYKMPGLYEQLFSHRLRCDSPRRVVNVFADTLIDAGHAPAELRVLDVGAGNGLVGEQLRTLGIGSLVGVDILREAEDAAQRDRPGLYDGYFSVDLCDLSQRDTQRILAFRPNCLVTVAALGFGDIPPKAFTTAFNLVSAPAWIVFNIKETFLSGIDDTGFSRLIRTLCDEDYMQIQAYKRYPHRYSVAGQRLFYVAIVARKLRPFMELSPKAR